MTTTAGEDNMTTLPVKLYCKASEIGQGDSNAWYLIEGHTFLLEAIDRAEAITRKGLNVRLVSRICKTPMIRHYGPEVSNAA